ncbi:flagellar basal body L-ring protein FlgH, partial [Paraburkholderia sp. 1N]|nr:flagellar basal body L-ring protein FlgH [Paraburkholderia solitsugae]
MTALRLTVALGAAACLAACASSQQPSIVETPMSPPL